jgi:TetR/AcrR family transcriptional regulator, tetracycline repressor protein
MTTRHNARARGQRAGLDLDQIVRAAQALDSETLTMQRLAAALNVDRKALNYYVKDRQALLTILAHKAFADQFSPDAVRAAEDWRAASRIYARRFVESALSLGTLSEHLWFEEPLTTWSLEASESLFARFFEAGFADEAAVRLVTMLSTLCLGHARDAMQAEGADERPRPRALREALERLDASKFANLVRILNHGYDTYGDEQIAFSIDVFITGAQAVLDARPA